MQRKWIVLALALIFSATLTGHTLAAAIADSPAATSCAVKTADEQEISDFLKAIAPPAAPELKVSCPAPYCVTNQDCINRPPGDASSTCEYGHLPKPPTGCGMCYY